MIHLTTEVIGGKSFDSAAADVWALGILFVNVLCCRSPWTQASLVDNAYTQFLNEPDFLHKKLSLTTKGDALFLKVLSPHASRRVTMRKLHRLAADVSDYSHKFCGNESETLPSLYRPDLPDCIVQEAFSVENRHTLRELVSMPDDTNPLATLSTATHSLLSFANPASDSVNTASPPLLICAGWCICCSGRLVQK